MIVSYAELHQQQLAFELDGVRLLDQVLRLAVEVDPKFSRYGRTSIIFLNQVIPSTSRWTFDIAHECGHLVMHRGIYTGSIETEIAADRFASAFLMPRRVFAREFRTSTSWPHIFDLKRRWRVSAAAIVRRAYDLGLLGAVGYRQAFKYMSAKGWRTTGEPYEPAFQPPELFAAALGALGTQVEQTLEMLCSELHFTPDTFLHVTGVKVPSAKIRQDDVILFPVTS